jgi:hypothetical protein
MQQLRRNEFKDLLEMNNLLFEEFDYHIQADIPELGEVTYYPKKNRLNIHKSNEWKDNGFLYVLNHLRKIKNNDGWTKLKGIKNEIKHDGDIWIFNKNGNVELWLENQFLPLNYATHWKPVIKPKPPIY